MVPCTDRFPVNNHTPSEKKLGLVLNPTRYQAQFASGIEMATLEQFSLPFAIDKKIKRYACYIDVDGVPHEASWTGDWAIHDFTDPSLLVDFQLVDFRLVPLQLTTEISTLWNRSRLLAFGSHASVRFVEDDVDDPSYPVVKLAHPGDETSRRFVEREFNIMREFSDLDAVAQVAPEPLVDEHEVFGFRLELLHRVDPRELEVRFQEVERLLDELHEAGWCHGDCNFSNIMMRKKDGRLVLIDLSFAGRIRSRVPEGFLRHLFEGTRRYMVHVDRERIRTCVAQMEEHRARRGRKT